MNNTCAQCRWLDRVEKTPGGNCRCNPPVSMLLPVPPSPAAPNGGMQLSSVVPFVLNTHFCGKFGPKLDS